MFVLGASHAFGEPLHKFDFRILKICDIADPAHAGLVLLACTLERVVVDLVKHTDKLVASQAVETPAGLLHKPNRLPTVGSLSGRAPRSSVRTWRATHQIRAILVVGRNLRSSDDLAIRNHTVDDVKRASIHIPQNAGIRRVQLFCKPLYILRKMMTHINNDIDLCSGNCSYITTTLSQHIVARFNNINNGNCSYITTTLT